MEPSLIKDIDDYNKVKNYTIDYISQLICQKQIRRKDSLVLILNDVMKKGYIPDDKWKETFFTRLLMYEPKHQGTDIDLWIIDLKRFVLENKKPSDLTRFFKP